MAIERPARRMTLRQQLTHAEKCTRDLIESFQGAFMANIGDLRDLSRPVRRRSHYPTLVAVINALNKLQHSNSETLETLEHLQQQMQEIREHARRERVNRL
jgi:hypothetical protein